ncbi:MAG TPA: PDZ domain-containing protein [Vicinamibacterales bacterium]|nr:PDZ domain-containing protein [Vicinamibacterales bacterium]
MQRWKTAAAAALGAATVVAALMFAPGLKGQAEREATAPQLARAFQLAEWFGGQIGVTVEDAESGPGVVVQEVRRDSPAEKAGVKAGDVIAEFDGERVRSARQFSRLVNETPRGRTVKMALQRGGQRLTVDVAPESRQFGRIMPLERWTAPALPNIPSAPRWRDFELEYRDMPEFELFVSRAGRLGVQIENVEDQLAQYFGVKQGVLVTSVAKDSPAARAGVKAGDVITKIGAETVENTADVRRELRRVDPGEEVALEVVREKKPLSLKVTLDPARPTRRQGTVT